jgi:hypothetical protein
MSSCGIGVVGEEEAEDEGKRCGFAACNGRKEKEGVSVKIYSEK